MSRKRFRWAVLGLVMIALGAILFQVRSSLLEQSVKELDRETLTGMLPQAVQWIQNFRRIEIKDGRKAWEIEAEEAQYLEEKERIIVRSPQATFYLKEGESVTVRGDSGEIYFDGDDLQQVVLRDNVEVHVRDYVIRVAGARYNHALERVVAKGPVHIAGDEIQVDGYDMVVFMKESRFEIQQRIRVTLLLGRAAESAS